MASPRPWRKQIKSTPLPQLIHSQIAALERTVAPKVWIRRDLLVAALGNQEVDFLIEGDSTLEEREASTGNLSVASKEIDEKGGTSSMRLVHIERQVALDALSEFRDGGFIPLISLDADGNELPEDSPPQETEEDSGSFERVQKRFEGWDDK